MHKRCKTAVIAIILAATAPAFAGVVPLTLELHGKQIASILNLPEGVKNPPMVLMMHGFTGSKNELIIAETETGLYIFMAERLADAGIASLRIAFAGSGSSTRHARACHASGQMGLDRLSFRIRQSLYPVPTRPSPQQDDAVHDPSRLTSGVLQRFDGFQFHAGPLSGNSGGNPDRSLPGNLVHQDNPDHAFRVL